MVPFVYSCHPCTRVAKESTANSQVTRAFPVLDAMIPLHHHHHPLRPQYTLFRFPLTRTGTFQRDEKTQTFKKKKGLLIPIRRTQKKRTRMLCLPCSSSPRGHCHPVHPNQQYYMQTCTVAVHRRKCQIKTCCAHLNQPTCIQKSKMHIHTYPHTYKHTTTHRLAHVHWTQTQAHRNLCIH